MMHRYTPLFESYIGWAETPHNPDRVGFSIHLNPSPKERKELCDERDSEFLRGFVLPNGDLVAFPGSVWHEYADQYIMSNLGLLQDDRTADEFMRGEHIEVIIDNNVLTLGDVEAERRSVGLNAKHRKWLDALVVRNPWIRVSQTVKDLM